MSLFFGKQRKPESLPEKFVRRLAFHEEMAPTTRAAIGDLSRQGQLALLIENYSHLVHDLGEIAVMLWRRGMIRGLPLAGRIGRIKR